MQRARTSAGFGGIALAYRLRDSGEHLGLLGRAGDVGHEVEAFVGIFGGG